MRDLVGSMSREVLASVSEMVPGLHSLEEKNSLFTGGRDRKGSNSAPRVPLEGH